MYSTNQRVCWHSCSVVLVLTAPLEDGQGGNKYEAALYGALCGDVRAMLPACETWEDEAWAYCRCVWVCSAGLRSWEAGSHLSRLRMLLSGRRKHVQLIKSWMR